MRADGRLLPGIAGRCFAVAAGLIATLGVPWSIPAARAQVQPGPSPGYVVVVGEGRVTVAPDVAQVRSGVTTVAKTVKESVETNSRTMAAVITSLTESGVGQKDIQTSQFSIQPVYGTPDQHSEAKLTGYRVSNQVTARLRHIDKLGDVLERLTAAGATEIGSVEFLVSDPSKALDEARQEAIADARRKAEVYARAAGIALGHVVSIAENTASVPGPAFARMQSLGVASQIPIATGDTTLHASATVGFDLVK
jgi:uncharacterized protein YggE